MEKNPWWQNVSGPFPTWKGPKGVKEDGGGNVRGQGRVGAMKVHRAVFNRAADGGCAVPPDAEPRCCRIGPGAAPARAAGARASYRPAALRGGAAGRCGAAAGAAVAAPRQRPLPAAQRPFVISPLLDQQPRTTHGIT